MKAFLTTNRDQKCTDSGYVIITENVVFHVMNSTRSVFVPTGNFLPGGGGRKPFAQKNLIFTKESKRNEGHIATT